MTLLACIAKDGVKIGPAVCVAEQVEERCFCPKAPIAISEVSTGTPDPRLKHQLPVLSARALAMYRKPPEQRYAGPALRVHNKEVADAAAPIELQEGADRSPRAPERSVAEGSAPDPIPATGCETTTRGTTPVAEPVVTRPEVPSGVEPRVCRALGCKPKALRSDNKTQLCSEHTRDARTKIGAARLGVPQVLYPRDRRASLSRQIANASIEAQMASFLGKENGVPIKPVESSVLAQVVDSPLRLGEPVDAGPSLPDPKVLPHAYLLLCVKEARRRIAELDENFTFITAKEA